MANYNTFVVMPCKGGRPRLVTSSARKAASELEKGRRVEVWRENALIENVYCGGDGMRVYIAAEKAYIREKQEKAQRRNAGR